MIPGAQELTAALGGRWHGRYGMARCPAHEDRDPSLSIGESKNGRLLVHCHANCKQRDVIAVIRAKGHWPGHDEVRIRTPRPKLKTVRDDAAQIRAARAIWERSERAGKIAARYFDGARGCPPPYPPSIRECQSLWCGEIKRRLPAIVCGLQDVNGNFRAVQRIYLKPDASGKADIAKPKLCRGPMRGAAVRLGDAVQEMVLAGGVEDALSVRQMYRVESVWAVLGEGGFATVEIPPLVKRVTIYGDADAQGRKMALRGAEALSARGIKARLVFPPKPFKDFNALLLGQELAA